MHHRKKTVSAKCTGLFFVTCVAIVLPLELLAPNRRVVGPSEWVAKLPCEHNAVVLLPSAYVASRIYGLCDDEHTLFYVDTASVPATITTLDLASLQPGHIDTYAGLAEIGPHHLAQTWWNYEETPSDIVVTGGLSIVDIAKPSATNYPHPTMTVDPAQAGVDSASLPAQFLPRNGVGLEFLKDTASLYVGFDSISSTTMETFHRGLVLQYHFDPNTYEPSLITHRITANPLMRMTIAGAAGNRHLALLAKIHPTGERTVGWLNPHVKLMVQQGMTKIPTEMTGLLGDGVSGIVPSVLSLPNNANGIVAFYNQEAEQLTGLSTGNGYFFPLFHLTLEEKVQALFNKPAPFIPGASAAGQYGIFLAHLKYPFVRALTMTDTNLTPKSNFFLNTVLFNDPTCEEPQNFKELAVLLKNSSGANLECSITITTMTYVDKYLYAARGTSLLRMHFPLPQPLSMLPFGLGQ